jgi:hypothetical protein
MKRLLLILSILTLACSGTLITPNATLSESVSTETPNPSPIPIPTAPTETPAPITCIVTAAEALHLRDTADIKGTVIDWLYPGEVLTLLPDSPEGVWVKVLTKDQLAGWVNSNFCKVAP